MTPTIDSRGEGHSRDGERAEWAIQRARFMKKGGIQSLGRQDTKPKMRIVWGHCQELFGEVVNQEK